MNFPVGNNCCQKSAGRVSSIHGKKGCSNNNDASNCARTAVNLLVCRFEYMTKSFLRICNCLTVSLSIFFLLLSSGCASKKLFSQDKMEGPFKDYDTACRDSIMHQWSNLERSKWPHRYGKIVLQFHFNYDGSVSDIKVLEDSVDAGQVVICQKAISSSAPFPPWPQDMKRMIGANYRVMTFTFNYYK